MNREAGDEASVNTVVGLRIRVVREALDITQADLARKAGVVRTQIVNIEAGRSGLSVERLLLIAKALNVKPARLLP